MEYRKDIDGLRAFAVLPVIFFHAGFEAFSGGFLGVDVFFVISGFLITSILLHELKQNKFSIINFYERRARRILPALFAVLFFTYLAGFIFLSAFEFKEFSQSLVSVIAFLSNIFFYIKIDYFSLAAEEMPLLHTWSLAIEEQFYIIFPPLLYVIWKFGQKYLLAALVLLSVVSFTTVIFLNHIGDPSASFYWPVSRAWELLAGSICALFTYNNTRKDRKYLSDLGLLILIACMFIWSSSYSHPGYLTIIPILATCLVILFPNDKSVSFKVLSNQTLVFVGLISYSLYLWHQPIFAFLRIKSMGHPDILQIALALILTFVTAYLSYRYVETPFRNKVKFNRKFIFATSSGLLALFLSIGLFGHVTNGFDKRYVFLPSYAESMKHSPMRKKCHASHYNYLAPDDSCRYFEEDVTWAVFGDSHTVEPAYALANVLKERSVGVVHHSYSNCPPALNYQLKGNELCSKWLNDTLVSLEENDHIENVLLGFRYSAAIFGDNAPIFPAIPEKVVLNIDSSHNLTEQKKLAIYWQSLEEIIVRLLEANKRVILLEPIPELPMHIGRAVSAFSIYGKSTLLDLKTSTTKEYYERRHKFILEKLRGLKDQENLVLINSYELLCHENGCPAVIGDTAMYFDDDHLSIDGSKILFERLQLTTTL